MAGEPQITRDPGLHALARSMRATFAHEDLWLNLPDSDRSEYLGYALAQLTWLWRFGFGVTAFELHAPDLHDGYDGHLRDDIPPGAI